MPASGYTAIRIFLASKSRTRVALSPFWSYGILSLLAIYKRRLEMFGCIDVNEVLVVGCLASVMPCSKFFIAALPVSEQAMRIKTTTPIRSKIRNGSTASLGWCIQR